MLWFIAGALATIALVGWLRPSWFKGVYETTVAWLAVGVAGALPMFGELFVYFTTDMTWTEMLDGVDAKEVALVVSAVLGIMIRHMNTKGQKE